MVGIQIVRVNRQRLPVQGAADEALIRVGITVPGKRPAVIRSFHNCIVYKLDSGGLLDLDGAALRKFQLPRMCKFECIIPHGDISAGTERQRETGAILEKIIFEGDVSEYR